VKKFTQGKELRGRDVLNEESFSRVGGYGSKLYRWGDVGRQHL